MQLRDDEITLRRPRAGDVDWIVDACRDPLNQRWLPLLPSPYEREHAEWWLRRAHEVWADGSARAFVIEDHRTGGALGVIEVRLASEPPDVGYWLAPGGRGRGAMTRALRLVVAHAFDDLGVERLELYTLLENVASQAVAERAGFARVGVVRGKIENRDGGRHDAYVFRLDRPL